MSWLLRRVYPSLALMIVATAGWGCRFEARRVSPEPPAETSDDARDAGAGTDTFERDRAEGQTAERGEAVHGETAGGGASKGGGASSEAGAEGRGPGAGGGKGSAATGKAPATPSAARRTRRTPAGRPIVITFDDLALDMPADTRFSERLLTPRVKELDGRRVSIKGFIYAAGIFQQTGITAFPLVKNTQCKFGPGGQAFCVILVRLKEGVTTDFTLRPVTVEGTLKVEPYEGPDGNTWSVYTMVGDRVVGG